MTKGLPSDDHFSGEKKDFHTWSKLVFEELETFNLVEVFDVVTSRPAGGAPSILTTNYFKEPGKVTETQIDDHLDAVWNTTSLAIGPLPSYVSNQDAFKLNRKKKAIAAYHLIFNSIESSFKTKLLLDQEKWMYPRGTGKQMPDALKFVSVLFGKVNPTTKVSASTLKSALEKADLPSVQYDVPKLLDFFKDTQEKICNCGDTAYDEYVRLLFVALETANCDPFLLSVNGWKDLWENGKPYTLASLSDLVLTKYNNLVINHRWKATSSGSKELLAMSAKIESLQKQLNNQPTVQSGKTSLATQGEGKESKNAWKFLNPTGAATMQKFGNTYYDCKKCAEKKGKEHFWAMHKTEDHSDNYVPKSQNVWKTRGGDAIKEASAKRALGLKVNNDFKVAMKAARTEAEVDDVLTQFDLN